MKSYIFSIITAALFVAGVSAQLTVNTPTNVVSCSPLQISFTGGTPPYIISVHPGATPNGDPLLTFNNVTGSPFTWSAVNFAAQTSLDITIRDNTGASAQSAPFTVQSGGSTTCVNQTATGSSAPAATTGSSGSSGAASPSGTSPSSPSGSSGSSTSKAATPSSSGNAAVVAGIPYSVAGVLGAVVAAVFV